jgi:hypothetical protein
MIRERMKRPKREELKNEGRKELLPVLLISGGMGKDHGSSAEEVRAVVS